MTFINEGNLYRLIVKSRKPEAERFEMTALHALRLAAAEQPDGDLKRLLTWAELHIGDQYERICELEDELKQADTENQRRANALNAIREGLEALLSIKDRNAKLAKW